MPKYLKPVPPKKGYRRGFEPRPGESESARLKRETAELLRRIENKKRYGATYENYPDQDIYAAGGTIDKKSRDTSARLRSGLVELNDRLSPLGSFPRDIASGLIAGASKGVNRMMGRAKADADKISAALADQPKKSAPQMPDKRPKTTPPKRAPEMPDKLPRTPPKRAPEMPEKRMIKPVEQFAKGGSTASKRGDGCATKGKTKGRMV